MRGWKNKKERKKERTATFGQLYDIYLIYE